MPKVKTKKKGVTLKILGYDVATLERVTGEIINKADELGLNYKNPRALVRKIEKVTVNRSPVNYKDSREQFEKRTHGRAIEFLDISLEKVISHYQKFPLPSSIKVEVKS